MTTTVHLADDQALLRAGFAMVINSQPDMKVTGQAGTGADALTAARDQQPATSSPMSSSWTSACR